MHSKRCCTFCVWSRNIADKQPVADEHSAADDGSGLCAEVDVQDGCTHPGKAYSSENTADTQACKVKFEESVIDDSKEDEDEGSLKNLDVDLL